MTLLELTSPSLVEIVQSLTARVKTIPDDIIRAGDLEKRVAQFKDFTKNAPADSVDYPSKVRHREHILHTLCFLILIFRYPKFTTLCSRGTQ